MTTVTDTRLRPFTLTVDPLALEDLQRRVLDTRWPERETVDDGAQGIGLDLTRSLASTWVDDHDFGRTVSEINAYDNVLTEVDGLDLHVLHARSPHPGARPLLLIHGWPSSVVEFLDVIPALIDPEDPADAFHVVVPSLPGHGFGARPTTTGWTVERTAFAFAEVMQRLGYTDYIAEGGDWGSFTAAALGHLDPDHVAGIHLTMPYAPKPDEPVDLDERDQRALATMYGFGAGRSGYAAIQSSRPQTLAYGLTDSPVGQLAFVAERFLEWADHDGDLFTAVSPRRILDTVTVYWLTATAGSAARLFWESWNKVDPAPVAVPTGCSVGPRDAWLPRAWCEKRFTDLRYWRDVERGGHFPALEVPASFTAELRAFVRTL